MVHTRTLLALSALALAAPALAAPGDAAQARDILGKGVGFATVKGRGIVPAYAEYLKSVMVGGGFAAGDVTIEKVGETAILHLVWKGSGKKPPFAFAGHMDVVEADPKDWVRNPFIMIEDNGYLFGRGVEDNKFDVSMLVATLVRMKAEGFKPKRDIHLFLSGDEETEGNTAKIQAKQAKAAGVEFMLNTDAGGGALGDDGKAQGYFVDAAEKTYGDYQMVVTDPGGHSSAPGPTNAIATLAEATSKLFAYKFPSEVNDITRASLTYYGNLKGGELGKAMVAFAANPKDEAAIALLRADKSTVGQIGTTCVPTMITGGHAPNALPQRATLTFNCRIFPGHSIEAIRTEVERLVGDPAVKVVATAEWTMTPASPLRPDVMGAVARAVAPRGVKPVPAMSAGATDGVEYRALGIPAYGVGGLFAKPGDGFAHGLNERIPVAAIAPALDHWHTIITELAK